MKTTGICFIVATATSLVVGQNAAAMLVDFNFSISYSGSSITGRLVGLNLDANGNGVEVDPASVLLFHVPTIVGLTASPSHPYVFVPHTYERSTYFSGTLISTTPGVYGFQVSNYTLSPPSQNLLMMDAGNDVTLVFNFGAGLCGECGVATYGIQAEEDALWPAINSFVSFSAVSLPGDFTNDLVVDAADYIAWHKTDGTQSNYDKWRTNFGQAAGAGTTTGFAAIDRVPEPATIVILFVGVMLLPLPHRMLRP